MLEAMWEDFKENWWLILLTAIGITIVGEGVIKPLLISLSNCACSG